MSHDEEMNALLYPVQKGLAVLPDGGRILLVNAVSTPNLLHIANPDRTTVWQWWKGAFGGLQGYQIICEAPQQPSSCDSALVRLPRQREEGFYVMAQALAALKPGGLFMVAAANDAGGKRIEDDMRPWVRGLQSAAKYKCRVVWFYKSGEAVPEDWIRAGDMQTHPATGYWTQPGLFSWDRIDPASAMLMEHIPIDLKGSVADPGCGYGALSDYVLKHCPSVIKIDCYDADARAVKACRRNIEKRHPGRDASFHWVDFASAGALDLVDHVIMNPPFHKDKAASVSLGQSFIAQAARMIRPGGDLYMVANAHLPYEAILRSLLSSVETLKEHQGFKIFYARR